MVSAILSSCCQIGHICNVKPHKQALKQNKPKQTKSMSKKNQQIWINKQDQPAVGTEARPEVVTHIVNDEGSLPFNTLLAPVKKEPKVILIIALVHCRRLLSSRYFKLQWTYVVERGQSSRHGGDKTPDSPLPKTQ